LPPVSGTGVANLSSITLSSGAGAGVGGGVGAGFGAGAGWAQPANIKPLTSTIASADKNNFFIYSPFLIKWLVDCSSMFSKGTTSL
jgi:hypothetical protein